ncbi:aquaporin-11 [Dermochelys coriacea]|uniref:aquaporin-11 n=1 Tax=Dermochelys coriacea TaxID=27794 RepID=UPI0018E8A063|nr:aquaporin-11 [Dermochelys coriacea]
MGLTMVLDDTWISLLLMAGTMMLVGGCRMLTRHHMYSQRPCPRTFLLEVFATFQICSCTNELRLLANVQPKPHVALALTYIFTVLHGLTLTGSTCNPCGTLQQILDGGISVKQGGLKVGAQFAGAVLARIYMRCIWSMGIIKVHSEALSEGCCNPIQTTETQAFCIELLFSTVFQLTILQFESIKPSLRVHLIALLITMLVYGGGNLTGAIFNPALAFSLHASCFHDKFWDYSLVYWMAPSLGTVLVAIVWREILPLIF